MARLRDLAARGIFSKAMDPTTIGLLGMLGRVALKELMPLEDGFLKSLAEDGIDGLSEKVQGWVRGGQYSRKRNRALKEKITLFDLMAFAWEAALRERYGEALTGPAGVAPERVHELNAEWFLKMILDYPADQKWVQTADGWHPDTEGAIRHVTDQISEEFDVDAAALREGVAQIFADIPARVQEYLESSSLYRDKVHLQLTQKLLETIERIDGNVARIDRNVAQTQVGVDTLVEFVSEPERLCRLGLEALAKQYLDDRQADVFRRKKENTAELPFLGLEQTYVEPWVEVAGELDHPLVADLIGEGDLVQPVRAAVQGAWGQGHKLVVLEADFGHGKSLTCRMLAADMAEAWLKDPQRPFPVVLSAPKLAESERLDDVIRAELEDFGLKKKAAEYACENYNLTLILDSFDEAGFSEHKAKQWFERLGKYPQVLVASRPQGLPPKVTGDHRKLRLQPFDIEQQRRWFECSAPLLQPERTADFEALTQQVDPSLRRVPILLLLAVWSLDRLPPDANRAALYDAFFQKIAFGKWHDVQDPHPRVRDGLEKLELGSKGGEEAFRQALRYVAWDTRREEGPDHAPRGLDLGDIRDILKRDYPEVASKAKELAGCLVFSALFRKPSSDTEAFYFAHRSFVEFLCAEHLAQLLATDEPPKFGHPGWLALADFQLSPVERELTANLILLRYPDRKSAVLALLDAIYDANAEVLRVDADQVKDRGGIRYVQYRGPRTVKLRPTVELLAAKVRGYSGKFFMVYDWAIQSPVGLGKKGEVLTGWRSMGAWEYELASGNFYVRTRGGERLALSELVEILDLHGRLELRPYGQIITPGRPQPAELVRWIRDAPKPFDSAHGLHLPLLKRKSGQVDSLDIDRLVTMNELLWAMGLWFLTDAHSTYNIGVLHLYRMPWEEKIAALERIVWARERRAAERRAEADTLS